MAESYDIHLTDPQAAAFKVRAFTSNGPIFPTSATPANTATAVSSSLLVYGKGHSNYGERIAENMLHIMENFSGSSIPQFPVSGQLWFARFTVLQTGSGYYEWVDDDADANGGTWIPFIPQSTGGVPPDPVVNGGYWFRTDTSVLSYGINDASHPLNGTSGTWLPRVYDVVLTLGVPDPATHKPRKVLRVYDGASWIDIDTVYASEDAGEPPTPVEGDLWINTTTGRLNFFTGGSFQAVALESDVTGLLANAPYLPLAGGILAGAVDMNANPLINLPTLTDTASGAPDDLDAANKLFVNTRIESALSVAPTNLGDLLNVTDTNIPNSYLKLVGGTWVNDTIQLADITDYPVAITPVELSYLDGVTSLVQAQIDAKVSNTGDTVTGPFVIDAGGSLTIDGTLNINTAVDVNGNFINNVIDPINLQDAATKNYVDTEIGSIVGTDQYVIAGVLYDTAATPTGRLPEATANVGDLELIYNDNTNLLISGVSPISHVHPGADITYAVNEDTILSDLTTVPTTVSEAIDQLDQIMVRRTKNRRFVQTAVASQTVVSVVGYESNSNSLFIFVDGLKKISSESGEQVAVFSTGPGNTTLTGLTNDATIYTASVVVDGGAAQPISVVGSTAQTFKELIDEINADIVGATAVLEDGELLIISDAYGTGSTIALTDTDLFSSLVGFTLFDVATPGTDRDYEEQSASGTTANTIVFNVPFVGGEIIESVVIGDSNKGLI